MHYTVLYCFVSFFNLALRQYLILKNVNKEISDV